MMKKILLTTAGFAAMGMAPALAADLAAAPYYKAPAVMPLPIYNWAGFYGGLNGGGGSSRNCWTLTNVAGVDVAPNQFEGCHDATGGMVGGQFGYRWQSSNWVFGVEAQGDWTNFSGSNASLAPLGAGVTNQTRIDALGLFTGQIGYAWSTLLWYTKGGAAVTHNKYTGLSTASGVALDQANETRWGGAIGTGLEYAFAPNWSVGVEYDHLFMGKTTIGFPATGLASSRIDNIKQDIDIGTVRVNYRFGAPLVAKY
jgi:outer membrane immunogenic protein